ncbi:MAG: hypothetical protein J6U54_07625 [Clostridiales bacterium]|nr:hypothetical protein [Clostridiales bacterium]
MSKCENCFHYELVDWEDDAITGKAIPIYWCEKGVKDCTDCSDYSPIEEED